MNNDKKIDTKDYFYYWVVCLTSFFGTADQKAIDLLKQQVKELYENQVDQEEILNDIISVANISRGLINQNIMKINDIIGTISSLNDTIGNIEQQLVPLFTARRFLFLHLEFLIPHSRVQELIKQLQNDITLIRQYLDSTAQENRHLSWWIHTILGKN